MSAQFAIDGKVPLPGAHPMPILEASPSVWNTPPYVAKPFSPLMDETWSIVQDMAADARANTLAQARGRRSIAISQSPQRTPLTTPERPAGLLVGVRI